MPPKGVRSRVGGLLWCIPPGEGTLTAVPPPLLSCMAKVLLIMGSSMPFDWGHELMRRWATYADVEVLTPGGGVPDGTQYSHTVSCGTPCEIHSMEPIEVGKRTLRIAYILPDSPFIDVSHISFFDGGFDLYVAPSESGAASLRQTVYSTGPAPDVFSAAKSIKVIPPGVPGAPFTPPNIHGHGFGREELRLALSHTLGHPFTSDDYLIVTHAGSGASLAIASMQFVAKPKAKLLMLTQGADIAHLRALAAGNEVDEGEHLFFLADQLSPDQRKFLYHAADLLIDLDHKSVWPQRAWEAIGCGLPTLLPDEHAAGDVAASCSGLTAPSRVFSCADASFRDATRCVDPGAVGHAITDLGKDARVQCVDAGIAFAADHGNSWDYVGEQWLSLMGLI